MKLDDPNKAGAKKAMENTEAISKIIDPKLKKEVYKKLVRKIYDNELKQNTTYSRIERHSLIKGLKITRKSPSPPKNLQGSQKSGLTPVKERGLDRAGE